jgi:Uma2 family endonuclease
VVQPISTPSPSPQRDEHDNIVVIRNATWADYQRHLELRGDKSVPRISYLEGTLELMTPSRIHEWQKSVIGRLVEAWCFETGVEISPYGSWTLEKKEVERGAEPDECYVVGDDPDPARPDLAIEVVWTSGGVSKLEIYRKLEVREVWFYERGVFSLFALRGAQYEPIDGSAALPGIDLELLSQYVDVKPMTRAVRQFREALAARG